MRHVWILIPLLALTASVLGLQDSRPGSDEDGATIDSTIAALYDTISGPPGPRDWDRFRSLFTEDGRLSSRGQNREGAARLSSMTPDGYIEGSGAWLEENGFFEIELSRTEERFGPIAHAFSTYETRREEGGEVVGRGINSIQLVHDGERWKIVSIFWTNESKDEPIPAKYLP